MNAYSRLRWYLFVLRNPILSRLFRRQPIWAVIPHTPANVEVLISLVLSELCSSKNPRYSNALLQLLRAVPNEELDANEIAIAYFVNGKFLFSNVHESIEIFQKVLILCFSVGAL